MVTGRFAPLFYFTCCLLLVGGGNGCLFSSFDLHNSFDFQSWRPQLHDSQKTIPVHPDDGGASVGEAKLNLKGSVVAPRLGLSYGIGTSSFQVFLGSYARLNPQNDDNFDVGDFDNDDDIEFRSANMKDIERLPTTDPTYAYAWIEPGNYTVIPFLGLRFQTRVGFYVELLGGIPSSSFRMERGYYRNDTFEPIERSYWRGYGWCTSLQLGQDIMEKRLFMGIQLMMEHYPAEFSGIDTDIRSYVAAILIQIRF